MQAIYDEIWTTNGINMIDELKQIKSKSMLTIDDESSRQFTGSEDLTVTDSWRYDYDDTCIVFVELDAHYLVAHNLLGETRYFVCEEYDSGEQYFDATEEDFLDEVELEGGDDCPVYEATSCVYSGEDTPDLCEYSADHHFDYMLIVKHEDEVLVYRGVEIEEGSIIL